MGFSTSSEQAGQSQRPVMALVCDQPSDPLCQALFQALAKVAPHHAIRFNPDPPVPNAIEVTLHRGTTGDSLSWRDAGGPPQSGATIRNTGEPADHASALVQALPDLAKATRIGNSSR
ncbi:hypothetical protein [Jannaschia pohangensis]|uniref:Uncharacterized protein n=1 Tax=Jannaschia pohangensis TaxID=390807 RepID=A0A1I3TIV8_9RHOB|nr:hypothetical protein [Jannaschia pohangensis]SFJ71164.1 hypothetical protein SAMN04488095_3476 [Jannaschia pohangensis]